MSFNLYYCYPDRKNPLIVVDSTTDEYIFIVVEEGKEKLPGKVFTKHEIHNLSVTRDYGEDIDWAVKKFQEFGAKHWPSVFISK